MYKCYKLSFAPKYVQFVAQSCVATISILKFCTDLNSWVKFFNLRGNSHNGDQSFIVQQLIYFNLAFYVKNLIHFKKLWSVQKVHFFKLICSFGVKSDFSKLKNGAKTASFETQLRKDAVLKLTRLFSNEPKTKSALKARSNLILCILSINVSQ